MIGATRTIQAQAGKTLLIGGPASFHLIDGKARILGAPLDSSSYSVSRGKQIPIEIRASSSFSIILGEEADLEECDGSTIPLSWHEAASALAEIGEGTAVVIGGPDTGKTTLCTFLSNFLFLEKRHVTIVDADIGQTDLGPPTTMAAAEVTASVVNLSQIEPSERIFIGLTSPARSKTKVIRSIKRLVELHARPEETVIVNTDGWIEGNEAMLYKLQMLEELQPIITLGIGGNETSSIIQAGKRAGLLLGSPDTIRERTRVDRKELRSLGYRKYLTGASLRTFRLNGTKLRYCLAPNDVDPKQISQPHIENMRNAIIGLSDADGFLEEIGVLKDIARSAKTVKVWSRISNTPGKIEIGDVRLNEEGRELTRFGPQ